MNPNERLEMQPARIQLQARLDVHAKLIRTEPDAGNLIRGTHKVVPVGLKVLVSIIR